MTHENRSAQSIAIIGGTGSLGTSLSLRLARTGFNVIVGSRDAARAEDIARRVKQQSGHANVSGHTNAAAADGADVVFVTVPFSAQQATLESIRQAVAGKLVVDTTVPLVPPRVARVQLPPAGCAAAVCGALLGDSARVVSALHNVSATKLASRDPLSCDVLVFGDAAEDREELVALLGAAGMRGIHGGPLINSTAAEAMTSVLISINRRYAVPGGAGIRITDLETGQDGSVPERGR